MSLPIDFDKSGIAYGLICAAGQSSITKEYLGWWMFFYTTEKGRNMAIAKHRRQGRIHFPIFKFDLKVGHLIKEATEVPFIPDERKRKLRLDTLWPRERG